MKLQLVAVCGALIVSLWVSSRSWAQSDAANPQAVVPAVQYRSVFRETTLGVEQERVDWRKANDDVGRFTRGHVDILKQEEMDGKAIDKDSKSLPIRSAPHNH
jgi:hypothetical protein